jgi:hypothetical protein
LTSLFYIWSIVVWSMWPYLGCLVLSLVQYPSFTHTNFNTKATDINDRTILLHMVAFPKYIYIFWKWEIRRRKRRIKKVWFKWRVLVLRWPLRKCDCRNFWLKLIMACLLAIINHEFLKCYYVEVMSILTVINERCHLYVFTEIFIKRINILYSPIVTTCKEKIIIRNKLVAMSCI